MATVTAGRRSTVFISAENNRQAIVGDLFERFPPPFDLEADMLFVAASAPTVPLRRSFAATSFLEVGGSTPLILWFSRVRRLCYGSGEERVCPDGASGFGYNELNVVALVGGRRLFIPVIFASAGLSQDLGRRYGMPKREAAMIFDADSRSVESAVAFEHTRSHVQARLLASGRIFAKAFDWPAPWWTWPADFPDGSFIRALVQGVPRLQLAWVTGTLALDEPWLPEPVTLWRLGLYVPGLRMRLPAP